VGTKFLFPKGKCFTGVQGKISDRLLGFDELLGVRRKKKGRADLTRKA